MDVKEIERLIKISRERPLMPDAYIPWQLEPEPDDIFLPEVLTSLQGLDIYEGLTATQKLELGRHELVQVIASYAWGECLFCVFMTRHLITLQPDSVEHQFLIRELIEEFRHQEMFDLHNIEESRHILFTKALLKNYSSKAGYIKRTLYSYVILFNILFVRTMYVKREIYQRIGMPNPDHAYKLASINFKQKFATICLDDIIDFVDSWKGFNTLTRFAWRWVLGAKV
ncbi:diiron oxygenase [Mucilaginibacter antarcticus]|uniref:Diiron oxygenase n=1 Tax=Mucilaginibacter antarcticus TaxID=1855725 RepID=A0ABW5XML8_9SPHI